MPGPVDNYIDTLTVDQQAELKRIQAVVAEVVPSAEQGVSYAIPAYLYKAKPVLGCIVNKKFLSLYPFSGKVVDKMRPRLIDFDLTAGSIHFTLVKPVPESVLREILQARLAEIDCK